MQFIGEIRHSRFRIPNSKKPNQPHSPTRFYTPSRDYHTMRRMTVTVLLHRRQEERYSFLSSSISFSSLLIILLPVLLYPSQLPQVHDVHCFRTFGTSPAFGTLPSSLPYSSIAHTPRIRKKNSNINIKMMKEEEEEEETKVGEPDIANSVDTNNNYNTNNTIDDISKIERSTILLLEHINLNLPHPADHAMQFYVNLLGCGYDPRRFGNVVSSESERAPLPPTKKLGTIWANAGRSQFHLPHGRVGQSILGKIGLRIRPNAWSAFQHRVAIAVAATGAAEGGPDSLLPPQQRPPMIAAVTRGMDRYQNEYIEITDQFQNVFYCRPSTDTDTPRQPKQPIVTRHDPQYLELYGAQVLDQYITYESDCTDCDGIDFIEFHCPVHTAEKIATFYNACFDVPVQVVEQEEEGKKMAIIAIGTIDIETGRTDQSLLFREVDDYEATKRSRYHYENDDADGDPTLDYQYHIAMYVGETVADFQQAYRNCDLLDLIYINPRFSDRADTLTSATDTYQQFRIQHIVDMTNGNVIFELEHEIRSIHHEAWLGNKVETEN